VCTRSSLYTFIPSVGLHIYISMVYVGLYVYAFMAYFDMCFFVSVDVYCYISVLSLHVQHILSLYLLMYIFSFYLFNGLC
jgi:hypothetical protein